MANNWKQVALGDVAADVTVGYVGTMATEYVETGVPFLRSQNVEPLRVNDTDLKFITKKFHDRLKKSALSPGDVVIVRTGKPGACAVIPQSLPVSNCSDLVIVRCGSELNPRFLAYYVNSVASHHINSHLVGAVQQHFNVESARKMLMRLPDLPEQRAIAHILGTLDDKIELNRRTSETLEAMGRALFKSWFVDFEPVRAKAEGRDPGIPKLLADLFPTRLVNSELGEIPEGWEAGSFGSISSQRTERAGSREMVVLSAVASGKLTRSEDHFTKRVYSKDTDKYLLVEQWDFVYNPSRVNIGSIGMLEEDLVGGVSPVYVVARPRVAYHWFLEFSLRRPQTKTWINTLASGSVRQSLSYYDFASIPSVIPPVQLAEEFNKRWSILRRGIRARQAESYTLATLRDALLPKLISGELRVKDAEGFIGRVTV